MIRSLFILAITLFCTSAMSARAPISENMAENQIIEALQSNSEVSLNMLSSLIESIPNYDLPKVIYADLLTALANEKDLLASQMTEKKLANIRQELVSRNRYLKARDKINFSIPKELIHLDALSYDYVVVVEEITHRLFLFENKKGLPVLLDNFYISVGTAGTDKIFEGDNRTPLGVYSITSFISANRLNQDRYGISGALPINYPNAIDLHENRTGYGIWIHGTPVSDFSRPPLASEGCVSLSDISMRHLVEKVKDERTAVLIAKQFNWLTEDQWLNQPKNEMTLLTAWKAAWESLDVDQYIDFYHPDFKYQKKHKTFDLNSWYQDKKRISQQKSFIKLDLSNISIFFDASRDVLVTQFRQHYKSSNFNGTSSKTLFWKWNENKNKWQILIES